MLLLLRPHARSCACCTYPLLQVGEPVDVLRCGELEYYDKQYDRITVKSETVLEKTGRAFRSVTTSDDPIMRRLASEGAAKVFATDAILTTLMCVKSSKYSWDLLITKQGGKIFFDKRADSNLNLLTVNETAPDEIPEDRDALNGVQQLALEATAANQNFSQQVSIGGGGFGGEMGAV
jgi:translation initiation factor 3 subunit D